MDFSILERLRQHWPEYLIEGSALGLFMLSALFFSMVFEHPGAPLHRLVESPDVRRALIGIAMGLTATALIYSPWGQRSGAHMNPAVTMSFWSMNKVAGADAAFYIAAQFIGASAGVLTAWLLLGARVAEPPVMFAITAPRPDGAVIAFVAEAAISCGLMTVVLWCSNSPRYAPYTGVCAGIMVALYITVEAPVSGMSMNPARSFASAAAAGFWPYLWIYFTAPPLGMFVATRAFIAVSGADAAGCAKLLHPPTQRCIHCGYEPSPRSIQIKRGHSHVN